MPRSSALKASGSKAPKSGAVTKKSKKSKSKSKAKPKTTKALKKDGTPRKWKPGTVATRQIKKFQKSTKLLLQKAPFQRLVRKTMEANKVAIWFKPTALEALQEATESYLVSVFEGAVILQLHRNKKTLTWKDLSYCRRIRGDLL
ncbi:histone H3.3 type 2 [Diplonema papillatum]|nr:histone H3.3 type 2 [Diplonema papillatum]KAJ9452036.1 histone H3.3 type 2 [Diplonema papillatum]KAJ9452037.1 histone H3.3 type 2 [Diplonema papillatum]